MSQDEKPFAYLLSYQGPGKYARPFDGSGYGVMFEDDGQTGYFYATTENFDRILDALHLYNKGDSNRPGENDQIYLVWNPRLQKAGIFYHNHFQAVVDFRNKLSCCGQAFLQALRMDLEDGPRLMHGTML